MSHRLLIGSLIVLLSVSAQAQRPSPASSPQQATPPPLPSSQPQELEQMQPSPAATPVPAIPAVVPPKASTASNAEKNVRLDFPNADVRDVLNFYSQLTKKRIVPDNTVTGPVNISITDMLTADEATHILETALLLNGFTLVPGDEGILKVVGVAKNPRSIGIPIISSETEIPDSDKVVSFLFKLQFADPTEVSQMLMTYVAPSLYTSVAPLPKAQAILITESSPVLRGLVRLIREIDVPPAEVISEFIALERADVKDVMEKLEKIFEKQPTQTGAAPVTPPQRGMPPPQQAEGQPPGSPASLTIDGDGGSRLKEDSIIIGKIKLTADIRTNRIHVVTRPVNLPFIRKLIKEFDSDIVFGEPTVRILRYVPADEVLDVVVKTIAEKGEKTEDIQTGQRGGQPASASTALNPGFQGSSSSYGGSSSSGLNISEGLQTQAKDTVPKAITVGNTKIIADLRNNSIIVMGNEEVKQKIFRVLDQLDTRAPQVMIRTVIGELSLNNQRDLGFNYFYGNSQLNTRVATGNGNTGDNTGDNPAAPPTSSGASRGGIGISPSTGVPFLDFASLIAARNLNNRLTPVLLGGATGVNAFISAGDSLGILVKALESTGRFRTVNSPVVFTSNNKKAIVASGEEIAVPTQTLSSLTNGNAVNDNTAVSSSIQYKQVALKLEVVPLINSDREVALDILQELNSKSGESTEVGGSSIPTIATRYIKTNVTIPDGATVALGGLISNRSSVSDSGIPYLKQLPVVGFLFKTKSKSNSRSELIILMKPEVLKAPAELADATHNQQEKLSLEADLEATLDESATDLAYGPNGERIRKTREPKTEKPTTVVSERKSSFSK